MIGYITVGASDLEAARAFYDGFLPLLGYSLTVSSAGLSYALPATPGQAAPEFYVKPPFDGKAASGGNGSMVAFQCASQAQVQVLHRAACLAGGQSDGAPGFRAAYGPRFYVAYLRDPQGNKLALFSANPADPARPG